jgi:hypothetical protein
MIKDERQQETLKDAYDVILVLKGKLAQILCQYVVGDRVVVSTDGLIVIVGTEGIFLGIGSTSVPCKEEDHGWVLVAVDFRII